MIPGGDKWCAQGRRNLRFARAASEGCWNGAALPQPHELPAASMLEGDRWSCYGKPSGYAMLFCQ